ncbi:MAG: hypothetical protein AAF985_05095, partial [Bacteroidota bacterium]
MFCSILPIIVGLGGILLGGLFGWYARRKQIEELTQALETETQHHQKWKGEYDSSVKSRNILQGKYNHLDNSLSEWKSKYEGLDNNFNALTDQHGLINTEFSNYKTSSTEQINGLNTDLKGLQSKYDDLLAKFKNGEATIVSLEGDKKGLETELDQVSKDREVKLADASTKYAALQSNFNTISTEKNDLMLSFDSYKNESAASISDWDSKYHVLLKDKETAIADWDAKYGLLLGQLNDQKAATAHLDEKYSTLNLALEKEKEAHQTTISNWDSKYLLLMGQFENSQKELETANNRYGELNSNFENAQ